MASGSFRMFLITPQPFVVWARSPVWIKAPAFGAGERGFKSPRVRFALFYGKDVKKLQFSWTLWDDPFLISDNSRPDWTKTQPGSNSKHA